MSTVINPKGARKVPAQVGPAGWASVYLASTVGQKVVVAATGLLLTGFLVGHLVGNLKMFGPPEAINGYAHFLKHELGAGLWVARGGLLVLFVTHIVLTLTLKAKSVAARPTPYVYIKAAQATLSSRTMIYTGLVVGAFTLFHLAHYTMGWVKPALVQDPQSGHVTAIHYLDLVDKPHLVRTGEVRHDVYSMVVAGFRNPYISALYVVAQLLLFAHLSHGLQSTVQTLGLKSSKFAPFWVWASYGLSGLLLVGNLSIVFAVWAGLVGGPYPLVK